MARAAVAPPLPVVNSGLPVANSGLPVANSGLPVANSQRTAKGAQGPPKGAHAHPRGSQREPKGQNRVHKKDYMNKYTKTIHGEFNQGTINTEIRVFSTQFNLTGKYYMKVTVSRTTLLCLTVGPVILPVALWSKHRRTGQFPNHAPKRTSLKH